MWLAVTLQTADGRPARRPRPACVRVGRWGVLSRWGTHQHALAELLLHVRTTMDDEPVLIRSVRRCASHQPRFVQSCRRPRQGWGPSDLWWCRRPAAHIHCNLNIHAAKRAPAASQYSNVCHCLVAGEGRAASHEMRQKFGSGQTQDSASGVASGGPCPHGNHMALATLTPTQPSTISEHSAGV